MIFFYILILAAPMPNHPLFEAPIAGLTVVKWIGVLCCVYALLLWARRRTLPALLNSTEFRAFLVLLFIAELSSLTLSRTGNITFSPMSSYFSFLLLFIVTSTLVDTHERLHGVLLAALAGVAMASLYVIREFQLTGGKNLRPGYVAGDSNYFAASAVLVIPVAVYFARRSTSRWERWFCIASLVFILLAFTLASSRGGIVGLCVVIGYMIVRPGKSRRAAIVTALILLPMLLCSPASPLPRLLHPTYGDVLGAQVRKELWAFGLTMIVSHPVAGIGLGNFTAYSYVLTSGERGMYGMACNTFLEIAAELGLPGLLAYCVICWGALTSAGKLSAEGKRRNDTFLFSAGEAIRAGLLGFIASAMFLSAEYQKPFWVIVALTATVPTLLTRQARELNAGRNGPAAYGARNYVAAKA
jgi:O-antigen ligase